MSIPLVDIHLKFVVDFTINQVLADPDNTLKEIFGDANIDPQAALYGQHFIDDVKKWITTTKIPVVLGFQLDPTKMPGVSINLQKSSPEQPFMGDIGNLISEPLQQYEREVLVPTFSPKNVVLSPDGTFITITLPDNMPIEQSQLVLPGLIIRDKNKREYGIGEDKGDPTAVQLPNGASLLQADLSEIQIISPVTEATFREGVMYFDELALITIHGHADRVEGLWLWAIVHWGLLKFRPLLTSTFGMDLAMATASDFSKDDSFLGENIWRRFITLSTKTVWSVKSYRTQDVVAFLLSIKASQATSIPEASVQTTNL